MHDDQISDGSTNRLERKIDALTGTVGEIKAELVEVRSELRTLGSQVTKVYVLAEKTDQFAKDTWDSLESLRKNVDDRFEEAKQDNKREFQLVHSAIRHLGEKLERIEEAPARAKNRKL